MPQLSTQQIARMIDLSCVRADSSFDEIESMIELAAQYRPAAVFALGGFTEELCQKIATLQDATTPEDERICVGATVGFPCGGDTTAAKVQQVRELIGFGCGEADMVQNVGKARSGRYDEVEADIAAVKEAAGDVPLKVILECHWLTDEQIVECCEAAVRVGADWVKSGTGWAPGGTTIENVALMKKTVGDRAKVKAAGGVRDLETLLAMHEVGVERFGIGVRTAKAILEGLETPSGESY